MRCISCSFSFWNPPLPTSFQHKTNKKSKTICAELLLLFLFSLHYKYYEYTKDRQDTDACGGLLLCTYYTKDRDAYEGLLLCEGDVRLQ